MAKKVAFSGVLSALTVILLYFAFILPSGKISLYALSSLPVALAVLEFGIGAGASVYVASSLIAFFITGIFGSLPYILFFGAYSLLKYYIEKSGKLIYELISKIICFNILLLIYYLFTVKLLTMPIGIIGDMLYILFAAAQIIFFVYDYVFSRLLYYYEDNIRKRLMKG